MRIKFGITCALPRPREQSLHEHDLECDFTVVDRWKGVACNSPELVKFLILTVGRFLILPPKK
jgi:hypothetical protein